MRKLSLKNLNLSPENLLGKNELKTVFGGGCPYGSCIYNGTGCGCLFEGESCSQSTCDRNLPKFPDQ